MPCCSGTKKMLISGCEYVCRTAYVYPLRVRWLWPRAGIGGRGIFLCPVLNALRCALCVSMGMQSMCVSILSAAPEGAALTPSLPCPTLARVVGLLLSHTLSSQAADVPRNAGKRGVGGLKAERHHATAAWISNTHTHTHWQSLAHVSYLLKLM